MGTLTNKAVHVARGAAAGALATFAMKGVMSLLESEKKMSIKDAFQDRKPAEREVIDRLNKRYKWKMPRSKRAVAARGVRWGLGIGAGMLGSYLTRRLGAKGSPFKGAAVSAMMFILIDEVLKPTIGVRPKPKNVPLQTHAAALAGHTTYGLVNAGAEQAMERLLPDRFGRV